MLTAHNCWCNFGRGHYEEHIFEIIIEYRRFSGCGLRFFYFKLGWSSFSVEHKQFRAIP